LRKTIAAEPFEHREKQPSGFVSISGGIAVFPKDGESVSSLVKLADEALYRSKKGGRNRVTLYKGVEIGDCDDIGPVISELGELAKGSAEDLR
jgi:predicted signal transduction protein with EAL and GGDEF domain